MMKVNQDLSLKKHTLIILLIILLYILFRYLIFPINFELSKNESFETNNESFKIDTEWWYLLAHVVSDDKKSYGICIRWPISDFLIFSISDVSNEKYYPTTIDGYELEYEEDKLSLVFGPNYWFQKDNPFNFNLHIENNQVILDLYLENKKPPQDACAVDFRPFKTDEKNIHCYLPRVSIEGNLTINDNSEHVKGFAWVEHTKFELQ